MTVGDNNGPLAQATVHFAEEYIPFGSVFIETSGQGTVTYKTLFMSQSFDRLIKLTASPEEGWRLNRIEALTPDWEIEIQLYNGFYYFNMDYPYATVVAEFVPETEGGGTEVIVRLPAAENG